MSSSTSMGTQQLDFAEFYRSAADECLRTVLVSVGDEDAARELPVPDSGGIAESSAANGAPASLVDRGSWRRRCGQS
jgi:hypothetical protein